MTTHTAALGRGLNELRERNSYTDFTVVADGKEFPCHRAVLAAVSPVFDSMFTNEMQEAQTGRVDLEFSAEVTELLLRYIYSGADVITSDVVVELYHAANYLQISSLIDACESFLKGGMRQDISLHIWQIANLFQKNHIAEVAKGIVLKNFASFIDPDLIGQVSSQTVQDILAEPFLNCDGRTKAKAVWMWLISQEEVTDSVVDTLIEALVRSPNVSSEDIIGATEDGNYNEEEENGIEKDVLKERENLWRKALDKHWIRPSAANNLQIVSTTMIENASSEWLMILGGCRSKPSKLTLFNFKQKKWFYMKAEDMDIGDDFAISSIGSLLYLTGGTKHQNRFMYFDIASKRWATLAPLPNVAAREKHNMVAVGHSLYILAGTSKCNPEAREICHWTTKENEWKVCGDLAKPVSGACSAVVGNKIFLLGGSPVNGEQRNPASKVLQVYELNTRFTYTIRTELPVAPKLHNSVAAVVGKDIYLVHKGAVYCVNEDSTRHMLSIPGAPETHFTATSFGDKIIIFGGEDDNFMESDQVLQFDVSSNDYVKLPLVTPFKIYEAVSTKIMVPLSWDLEEV